MQAFALTVAALLLVSCGRQPNAVRLDPAKLVDLSHTYDDKTIYWPTSPPFSWKKDAWGPSAGGYWYASATFTSSEHGGTHLDSPLHFAEGKWAVAEIPIERLAGQAKVLDIAAACERDPSYRLTAADIASFESANGTLNPGDIVLVRTNWSRRWPDRKAYMGSDKPGDTSMLRFPGISREAAEQLVARKVSGVGIDTASLDHGPSTDFATHRALTAANVYGLENLTNLDRLPVTGASVIALPMKIAGGSGAPVRVAALLP